MRKFNMNCFQKILFIIMFILLIAYLIIGVPLQETDELWNFQNVNKMANGLLIYKDANVIITPLFFYIAKILFKIFGSQMLVFRIYNVSIWLLMFITIKTILKKLNVSKKIIVLFITIILELTILLINSGANYNILAMLVSLIGMSFYINKKKSNDVLQGIFIFLVFASKQNTGIYYALALMIYELYANGFSVKYFLSQIKKGIVFFILSAIMCMQMYFSGNFADFINYAFGGILEFGNSNISYSSELYYVTLLIIVISLYIVVCKFKNNKIKNVITETIFDNLTLIFIFSVVLSFTMYPIINSAHVVMLMPLYLIFICYLFNVLLLEDFFGDMHYEVIINWISIILMFIILSRMFISFAISNIKEEIELVKDTNSHFKYIYVEKTFIDKSNQMQKYVKEKNTQGIDVIICASDSALTMIELNQSHGVYDLLFNGNLGYNGIEKIKQDILTKENTEFLIVTNEEDMFWQDSRQIRDFIKENLTEKDVICNYTVYVNK